MKGKTRIDHTKSWLCFQPKILITFGFVLCMGDFVARVWFICAGHRGKWWPSRSNTHVIAYLQVSEADRDAADVIDISIGKLGDSEAVWPMVGDARPVSTCCWNCNLLCCACGRPPEHKITQNAHSFFFFFVHPVDIHSRKSHKYYADKMFSPLTWQNYRLNMHTLCTFN